MTTSAIKIVNATSNNNNNNSSNNHNNNDSNNNNYNKNISKNTNTCTTSNININNNNNNNKKITNKNFNNFSNNKNNIECITTTNNVKILNSPVAPTTLHILSKEKLNANIIMRANDKKLDMDMIIKEQQELQECLAAEREEELVLGKEEEAEEFSMKIENLSMGIKMPLNMTKTTNSCTIAATTTTTTTPLTSIKNNNNMLQTITTTALTTTAATTRAMQSDEDFNIRFVNLVRNHKCLYDKKVPEYRNRDNQEKAWSLISHETRESVIHCKERWRNLRACLSRYIKQQSSNDPQHKPYYLTEHMSFLLPFLKSTRNGAVFPMEAHNHHHNHAHDYEISNNHLAHQQQTTLNGVNNLSALFQISSAAAAAAAAAQQQLQQQQPPINLPVMSVIPLNNEVDLTTAATGRLLVKHSLSENNDDEETIDAFDPAISSTFQRQQQQHFNTHTPAMQYQQQQQQQQQLRLQQSISPALSDTASANSMQHFIPDVQLSEAPSVHDVHHQDYNHNNNLHDAHVTNHMNGGANVSISPVPLRHEAKRIKLESDGTPLNGHLCHCGDNNSNNNNNNNLCTNPDMEFFRSILPDIVNLTAQQKRKFKIGILELIDDVVTRYPAQTAVTTTTNVSTTITTTPCTGSVITATSMPMSSNHMLNNNNFNNNKSHRNFVIHERRK